MWVLDITPFFADYDSSGALECKDPVSFRLTPNLQNFITRTGVDGPFLASMRAAAQAIAHKVLLLLLLHNCFNFYFPHTNGCT